MNEDTQEVVSPIIQRIRDENQYLSGRLADIKNRDATDKRWSYIFLTLGLSICLTVVTCFYIVWK